jgi:hypothetical protein
MEQTARQPGLVVRPPPMAQCARCLWKGVRQQVSLSEGTVASTRDALSRSAGVRQAHQEADLQQWPDAKRVVVHVIVPSCIDLPGDAG